VASDGIDGVHRDPDGEQREERADRVRSHLQLHSSAAGARSSPLSGGVRHLGAPVGTMSRSMTQLKKLRCPY